MPLTIRLRSVLGMLSSSFEAEGLIRILYFSTGPQIFEDLLKIQIRLVFSLFKSGQIFNILDKTPADSLIDQLGQRLVVLGRLNFQGLIQIGIKIDSRSFWRCFHR